MPKGKKLLCCNVCSFQTKISSKIIQHYKVNHSDEKDEHQMSPVVEEQSVHQDKDQDNETEDETVCRVCDLQASSGFEMLKHLNNFHFSFFQNNVRIPSFDVSEFKLKCMHCEERFTSLLDCRFHCIDDHQRPISDLWVTMTRIEKPDYEGNFRFDSNILPNKFLQLRRIKTERKIQNCFSDEIEMIQLNSDDDEDNGNPAAQQISNKKKKTNRRKKIAKRINHSEPVLRRSSVGLKNATNIYTELLIETVREKVNRKNIINQFPAAASHLSKDEGIEKNRSFQQFVLKTSNRF